LFALDNNNILHPVCIKLEQHIYTPNNHKYQWLLAKIYLEVSNFVITLLLHIVFEHQGIGLLNLCMKRNMANKHPVMLWFWSHITFVDVFNIAANFVVTGDKAGILLDLDSENILAERLRKQYKLEDLAITSLIKNNDILDLTPNYKYAARMYSIVTEYVTNIINSIYTNDKELANDTEIQNMFCDYVKSLKSKMKIHNIKKRENLIDFFTTMLWIIIQHGAEHNGIQNSLVFSPGFPFHANKYTPKIDPHITEKEICKILPDIFTITFQTAVGYNANFITTNRDMKFNSAPFGTYPDYMFHISEFKPIIQLQNDLSELEQHILHHTNSSDLNTILYRPSTLFKNIAV